MLSFSVLDLKDEHQSIKVSKHSKQHSSILPNFGAA